MKKEPDKRGGHREGSGRPPQGNTVRLTTSINIESHLLAKLDSLAAKTGQTRSDIINNLLREL